MRTLRSATLVGFLLFAAGATFADTPRNAENENKPASTTLAANNDAGGSASARYLSDPAAEAAAEVADPSPAPAAQGAGDGGAPAVNPMAATTGTLGLFMLETGQNLPKGGWSASGYLNKFSRMPGSVTVLNLGMNFGVGITNRLSFYAD